MNGCEGKTPVESQGALTSMAADIENKAIGAGRLRSASSEGFKVEVPVGYFGKIGCITEPQSCPCLKYMLYP